MSTASSRSRCAELRVPKNGWVLPERLWPQMRMLWGEILTESEIVKEAQKCKKVISVGDVVSLALIQNHVVPHLTIYDRSTERRPMTALDRYIDEIEGRNVVVKNEPGTIGPSLVEEVEKALRIKTPTKMLIEGEEDLAALVCAAVAPDRSCLIYGIPKRGMTMVRIDVNVRERAKRLINEMEESN